MWQGRPRQRKGRGEETYNFASQGQKSLPRKVVQSFRIYKEMEVGTVRIRGKKRKRVGRLNSIKGLVNMESTKTEYKAVLKGGGWVA